MCDALTDQAQELLGQDLGIQAGECEEAAGEVASFATSQGQQAPSTRSGTMPRSSSARSIPTSCAPR